MPGGVRRLLRPDDPPLRLNGGLTGALLVAVAHPDDETVGAGALLARISRTVKVHVVHATDGVPRDRRFVARGFAGTPEEYGRARRRELETAMALAGIGPERLVCLGIRDQEAVNELPRLARELTELIRQLAPAAVLTLAYEGGHPDHDAMALAVQTAVAGLEAPPPVFEMPLYHAGPDGRMAVGRFLGGPPGERLEPSEEERALKGSMIAAFETQRETLAAFLPPRDEVFRPAPVHDFTRPPHPGRLQYEVWGFPITGEEWRKEARLAFALQV